MYKPLNILRAAVAVTLLLAGSLAWAQMYSWKDPTTGATRFSNIAPPWYSTGETVSGPRVILSYGSRVIDDTSLPYEERLLLSGKTPEQIEKLRLLKRQEIPIRQQEAVREPPVKSQAGAAKRDTAIAPPAGAPPEGRKRS